MSVSVKLADVLHKLIDHVSWREEADRTEAHQVLNDETQSVTVPEGTEVPTATEVTND